MNYIYKHKNPEILKLGFGSMALYREKKPEETTRKSFAKEINKINEDWHKSWFIAYLKEPEFKVGEIAYKNGIKYKITLIKKTSESAICMNVGSGLRVEINLKDLSHYYLGQEVESFKYARAHCPECGEIVERKTPYYNCCHKCQVANVEAEIEWQEVEEPEEEEKVYIDDEDIEKGYAPDFIFTNDEYTQFQEELKSGAILLEVITKTIRL